MGTKGAAFRTGGRASGQTGAGRGVQVIVVDLAAALSHDFSVHEREWKSPRWTAPLTKPQSAQRLRTHDQRSCMICLEDVSRGYKGRNIVCGKCRVQPRGVTRCALQVHHTAGKSTRRYDRLARNGCLPETPSVWRRDLRFPLFSCGGHTLPT